MRVVKLLLVMLHDMRNSCGGNGARNIRYEGAAIVSG